MSEEAAEAAEAVERGRAGGGPSFIECQTYRFTGHHPAEATQGLSYRSTEEIDAWRARDPVSTWPGAAGQFFQVIYRDDLDLEFGGWSN